MWIKHTLIGYGKFSKVTLQQPTYEPHRPRALQDWICMFFFLPEIPSPPFATPDAALDAVDPCGALQSSTLPCPTAARVQLVRQHPTNIRQGYACLFPSLPFPSRCTKSNTQIPNIRYLFSDLTMILPTKFDLFATVVFVFASDHVCFRIWPCPNTGSAPDLEILRVDDVVLLLQVIWQSLSWTAYHGERLGILYFVSVFSSVCCTMRGILLAR